MHLRAVGSAARIGASLDPFSLENVVVGLDTSGVMHFDSECGNLDKWTPQVVRLDETYLYKHCPDCLRPFRMLDRVESYAEAVENLQRAKLMLRDAKEARGPGQLRLLHGALNAGRLAVKQVMQTNSFTGEVAKCLGAILREAPKKDDEAKEVYLDWAASFLIEPETCYPSLRESWTETWRPRFEHARGELRMRGWPAFEDAFIRGEETKKFKERIREIRDNQKALLCSLGINDEEGDLILSVAEITGISQDGNFYTIVPAWATEVARFMGGQFKVVGEIEPNDVDLLEVYVALVKNKPDVSLGVAKRLARAAGK